MHIRQLAVRAALGCAAAGAAFALWSAVDIADRAAVHLLTATAVQPAAPLDQQLPDSEPDGSIGQLIDSLTTATPTPATQSTTHCKGAPGCPVVDHIDLIPAGGGNSPTTRSSLSAELTLNAAPTMLARIHHARARSTIPRGHSTLLDPRPA